MLVLSRAPGEKLVLPTVGVTIEVLRAKGKAVRLGIDAPDDIPILREELIAKNPALVQASLEKSKVSGNLSHAMRNRLNALALALHLYQKQLERGMTTEAQRTFAQVLGEFETIERDAAAKTPRASSDSHRKALVVEDDHNECELLAGVLRMNGYDVVTADDGDVALGYLSTHERPDVMLLDMLMPRCDGPTTIDAIRKNPRLEDMKVFALSGTSPVTLGVQIGPHGIDRWFSKPVNPETLVRELQRELHRSPVGTAKT
jgi:carbon storage regulator CsrA